MAIGVQEAEPAQRAGRLQGRVAVVTGGGAGIGAAYARRLAELGATVVIADIDIASAEALAQTLIDEGGTAAAMPLDLGNPGSIEALAGRVAREYPRGADILVNNAAFYRDAQRVTIADCPLDFWRRMLDVNLTGAMLLAQAFIPQLRDKGHGCIVNQASAGAFFVPPGSVPYSVSKAGLLALTKGLAQELGPHGVRVNAIAPGVVLTDATVGKVDGVRLEAMANAASLRRNGQPEDLCGALEFLVSEESAWMTGQTLLIDGGIRFLG